MTPSEINQTIAAHIGWKQDANGWWSHPTLPDNGGAMPEPPDYCGDLNACHEMEKALAEEQQKRLYVDHLAGLMKSGEFTVMAPALQRSEAFLRVIGKTL